MESTGTNGEEPRIIREKCPLILLEHLKKLQIPRFTAWHYLRWLDKWWLGILYFDESFEGRRLRHEVVKRHDVTKLIYYVILNKQTNL